MNQTMYFALGVALGLVAARALMQPSDCCVRVAAGVRDRVKTELGDTAAAVGDALGVWQFTPGLLALFHVEP